MTVQTSGQDVLLGRSLSRVTYIEAMDSLQQTQGKSFAYFENSIKNMYNRLNCLMQFPDEDSSKPVVLPRQLEVVTKATEFPSERHRWNTNEVYSTCGSKQLAHDKSVAVCRLLDC